MKVSVCLATFNGEKFISDQITSILSQLASGDEIIISDDGSTDKTLSIIKSFNDERIKIYNNKTYDKEFKFKFSKVTKNFENALSKVTGDIIYLSDQDDVWHPNKISICNKVLESFDLVLHDCEIVDEMTNVIKSSYFEINRSGKGLIKNLVNNSYLGCCMAFKKNILDYSLKMPINVPHDIWIGLISEVFGSVYFEKTKLIKYRRHGKNLSPSGEKSNNSIFYKLYYRIIIVALLVKRISFIFLKKNNENITVR